MQQCHEMASSLFSTQPLLNATVAVEHVQQPDGNIHPLGLAAWWPYHAGLHLKLAVGRGVKDEPLYNQILPGW